MSKMARPRAKFACDPCRGQKRRCDGELPCGSCVRYKYECQYPSKRQKGGESANISTSPVLRSDPEHDRAANESSRETTPTREANSGRALPRLLGARAQIADYNTLQPFAWNFGLHDDSSLGAVPSSRLVTHSASKVELQGLAVEYFEKFHPIYPFLGADIFYRRLADRWSRPNEQDPFDGLLCGITAIGSLFAGRSAREGDLISCAKTFLESSTSLPMPQLDHIAAWILHSFYLRMTSHPHVCWIATCTLMHMCEAIGLHRDAPEASFFHRECSMWDNEIEYKRRMYSLASMLNTIASYECGRSRVRLRGITVKNPTIKTGELFGGTVLMHQISDLLDPETSASESGLENGLEQLESYKAPHQALLLIQTHQIFCIYRRLRLLRSNISSGMNRRIIARGKEGIDAAVILVNAKQPWWHAANVPFQFICVLLAMDSKEAIAEIRPALEKLQGIARAYPTKVMRDAAQRAELLVRLFQKQKDEESKLLADALVSYNSNLDQYHFSASAGSLSLETASATDDWTQFDLSILNPSLEGSANMNWDFGLFPGFSNFTFN